MNYVIDVIIILIAFFVYGYTHSLLASVKIKEKFRKKFGSLIAFYRLVYNLTALIFLFLLYLIVPKPDIMIYDLPSQFDILILILKLLSAAGIIWSLKYFSAAEFLGINQIKRWYKGRYNEDELDEKMTLKIEGPYKYIRHPLYFFTIMFLFFTTEMDLFYLTVLICFILYFYIGSVYEEKKLVEKFGKKYIDYQNKVPAIFPVSLVPYSPKNYNKNE